METYYYEFFWSDEIAGALEVSGTEEGDPWDEIKLSYPKSYDLLDTPKECRVGELIHKSVAIHLGILSDDEVLEMIGRLDG